MTSLPVSFRGRRFLHEAPDGWRTDDGHHLRINRGAYSRRMIGRLECPDGTLHHFTTVKEGDAATILDQAEDLLRQMRQAARTSLREAGL